MRNLKLTIQYHGADFFGWQKQTGKRTVQGELERAFFVLTHENVVVEGSGRTDRGVHALAQVASVKIESPIPLSKIKNALNNILPADVRICKVQLATADFHARFSAKRKTYEYVVQVGGVRSAINHNTLAYFSYDVDLQKMKNAVGLLIGKHNFHGFCASDTTVLDYEREIFDVSISKKGKILKFAVSGNGFLHNMVRIVVGTFLDVGRGAKTLEDVKNALDTGQRKFAGKTMEACGLYLKKVEYEI